MNGPRIKLKYGKSWRGYCCNIPPWVLLESLMTNGIKRKTLRRWMLRSRIDDSPILFFFFVKYLLYYRLNKIQNLGRNIYLPDNNLKNSKRHVKTLLSWYIKMILTINPAIILINLIIWINPRKVLYIYKI